MVKCGYCDFNSYAGVGDTLVAEVVDALLLELATHRPHHPPSTVFLGGGTPTHLEPAQLEAFLTGFSAQLDLGRVEEFSSEANPESVDEDRLAILADHGVGRLSIGVQSLDRDILRFLDRPHGPDEALAAYSLARARFDEVNVDLIYGVPGQSLETWLSTLDRILELEPSHLSCYCLAYEPGTPLHADLGKHRFAPLPESLAAEMLVATHDRLGQAGLPAYEISNFAKPGHECRHNLNYWRGGNYIGIGPGAAGHRNGLRTTNCRSLKRYIRSIRDTGSATEHAETLDPDQRCREAIWLGLRLVSGADLAAIHETTGRDPRLLCAATIDSQVERGLCRMEDHHLQLTRNGLRFADGVAADFLASC